MCQRIKPAGRGSTGRQIPNDLLEQLAMESALTDPFKPGVGNTIRILYEAGKLNDPRWPDWQKWEIVFRTSSGRKITIHFLYDPISHLFDDFKFK
jgi:filamentous hemagglutinin